MSIKTCTCCGEAITAEQWAVLPLVGEWRLPWGEVQEMRNCECNSTLSIVIEAGEA